MITEIEYALLAGAAYYDTRTDKNRLPLPQNWSYLSRIQQDLTTGFEASAFQSGTNIVISFAGTYEKPNNPLTNPDMQADIALAAGSLSAQLKQAADYYLAIKANAPTNATITFTGHSLGGGLAALMAVMFGESAQTFDQAPFLNSALTFTGTDPVTGDPIPRSVAINLRAYLADHTPTGLLAPLDAFIAASDPSNGNPIQSDTLAARSTQVSNINVNGEFLSTVPWNILDRIGTTIQDIANGAGIPKTSLHSIALLTVMLQSGDTPATVTGDHTLGQASIKLTDLLKLIFDRNLYASDTDTNKQNFLEDLVRHQAGVAADPTTGQAAIAADAMVTRFTDDLWKIAQDGGLTLSDKNLADALIAFDMQKYYQETPNGIGAGQELYNAISGGIQFDTSEVMAPDGSMKGVSYFRKYLVSTLVGPDYNPNDLAVAASMLAGLREWYIQAGTSGMNAADALNQGAFMLGGMGNNGLVGGAGNDLLVASRFGIDTLDGGAGNDVLMAGSGNDVLITGQGNDTVYGGSGNDTFNFVSSGSGAATETIKYDNGKGSVEVNGTQLIDVTTLLTSTSTGSTWSDSNGDQYQFVASADFIYGLSNDTNDTTGTLTITQGLLGSGNQIVIDNFDMNAAQSSAGYLGMQFREQLALQANASATSPFTNGVPADQTAAVGNGNAQTFTVYASSVSSTDQTIQLASSGAGNHARQTAAGVLPANRRHYQARRQRHPQPVRQRAAPQLRRRAAGDHPVLRHPLRQPADGQPPCQLRRHRARLPHGRNPRRHRETAAGLPDRDRRTRRGPVRRAEAAHRHRTGAAQATQDPAVRRSHQQPGCTDVRTLCRHHQSAAGQGHDAVHRACLAEEFAGG
jgi:hypothetical protein